MVAGIYFRQSGNSGLSQQEVAMYSGKKRLSMSFVCLLCALIMGMCLGTIPADSFLEYTDISSAEGGNTCPASSIRSPGKSVPSAQIFENRSFGQYETALSLRRATGKHAARTGRSLNPVPIAVALFSLVLPHTASACPYGFFHEAASHTTIISYIHRKDGQKPSPLFLF